MVASIANPIFEKIKDSDPPLVYFSSSSNSMIFITFNLITILLSHQIYWQVFLTKCAYCAEYYKSAAFKLFSCKKVRRTNSGMVTCPCHIEQLSLYYFSTTFVRGIFIWGSIEHLAQTIFVLNHKFVHSYLESSVLTKSANAWPSSELRFLSSKLRCSFLPYALL